MSKLIVEWANNMSELLLNSMQQSNEDHRNTNIGANEHD